MILVILFIACVVGCIVYARTDQTWAFAMALSSGMVVIVLGLFGLALTSPAPSLGYGDILRTETYKLVSVDSGKSVSISNEHTTVFVEGDGPLPETMELYVYEIKDVPGKNGVVEINSRSNLLGNNFIFVPWKNSAAKSAVIYTDKEHVAIAGLDG